jgi:hypothetical protein
MSQISHIVLVTNNHEILLLDVIYFQIAYVCMYGILFVQPNLTQFKLSVLHFWSVFSSFHLLCSNSFLGNMELQLLHGA